APAIAGRRPAPPCRGRQRRRRLLPRGLGQRPGLRLRWRGSGRRAPHRAPPRVDRVRSLLRGGRRAGPLAVKPGSTTADITSVRITLKTKLYAGIGVGVLLLALLFKLLVLK